MPRTAPIYLDYLSTTPVDPLVLEEMLPYFSVNFGNTGSPHFYGWEAGNAVRRARDRVASLIAADPGDVIFTASATEANNLAIRGVYTAAGKAGGRIITSSIEHSSVRAACEALVRSGAELVTIPNDGSGRLDVAALERALDAPATLVSIQHANNEIGTVQDLPLISALCHARGVLLHTDAAQSAGKIPLDVAALGADLLTFSAHKMYGPKGAAALFIRPGRPRVHLDPIVEGGGQERGLRAGTLNVPAIVGFGRAAELARALLPDEMSRLGTLRDRCETGLREIEPSVRINGHPVQRLPGATSVTFPGRRADRLLRALNGIAISSGSACASGEAVPSRVLTAVGLFAEDAAATLRICFGRPSGESDLKTALDEFRRVLSASA
ncbi:MAG: cysteine desulfurase [Ignavibacteriae bacterium]|nr:cysteine desulfurase [Ignavibacteriota bacterium]